VIMELNVVEHERLQEVQVYGPSGTPFPAMVRNTEEPGRYFHMYVARLGALVQR
jgi:hypothetical protein